jgi:succinate dehydrogenase / fumarate reductase, cytochrome b subunit
VRALAAVSPARVATGPKQVAIRPASRLIAVRGLVPGGAAKGEHMPDMDRGNRPLSPFMIGPIYRPQITSVMSIAHRLTGMAMALAAVLGVWWFGAAATDAEYFDEVNGLLTSWLGDLIFFFSLLAFAYHFCNGIRHLMWDTGYGLEVDAVTRSGYAALAGGVVLTVLIVIVA